MDVIPDGELNLFGLFHANATKSAASGASATMAGITVNWAIAALVAASAIIFMIHQLNRSLLDKRNTAVLAVDSMKNYCIKEYCERFNVKMDRMQDLLREILKMRYGLNEEYANIQNIYDTIRAFEKQLVATTREINDAGAQMGWTV
jgi:malate synthase